MLSRRFSAVAFRSMLLAVWLAAPTLPTACALDWSWIGEPPSHSLWSAADHWWASGSPGGFPDDEGDTATISDNPVLTPVVDLDFTGHLSWLRISNSAATLNLNANTLWFHSDPGLVNNGRINANAGTATINCGNGSLANTSTGQIVVADEQELDVFAGYLGNSGTISLYGGPTGSSVLKLTRGDTRLGGPGVLLLSDSPNNWVVGPNTYNLLYNYADHTIRGAGHLGDDNMQLENSGLIDASAPLNPLIVDLTSGASHNPGTMQASGGGRLHLRGLYLDNSGRIQALAGSKVQIQNAATVSGGTLSTSDDGVIELMTGSRIRWLTSQGNLTVPDGQSPEIPGSLTNNGNIRLLGTASNTVLLVSGWTTLEGSGAVVLPDNDWNAVKGVSNSDTLIHAAGHTIRGSGKLGDNCLQMRNYGLIEATQATPLVADLWDQPWNVGTMQAHGGDLLIRDTYLVNYEGGTSGTIRALDHKVQLQSGAVVVGGTLNTAGSGVIELMTGSALRWPTNQGLIQVPDGQSPRIWESLTNNGTLELRGTSTDTCLLIDWATLAGNGQLVLGDGGFNAIRSAGSWTRLTNDTNHTIRGSGRLGDNYYLQLWNYGLIEATNPGNPLVVDLAGDASGNSGILQANGGTLQIRDTNLVNERDGKYGAIRATAGSRVQLLAGATISNGTLEGSDSSPFELHAASRIRWLATQGTVQVPDGESPTIEATIANNGTIRLLGSSKDTYLCVDWAELAGNGQVLLGDSGFNAIRAASGWTRLTNDASHSIRGSGRLGDNYYLQLWNLGLIEATNPGNPLVVDLAGDPSANPGTFQANGGTLQIRDTNLINERDGKYGSIRALAGSKVQLQSGATISYGTLEGVDSGSVELLAGSRIRSLTTQGTLYVPDGESPTIEGTITNNGTIRMLANSAATCLFVDGATLAGNGQLVLSDNPWNVVKGPSWNSLTNGPNHTIRGSGNLGDDNLTLANNGLVVGDQSSPLVVALQSGFGSTNNGTMRAAGAGSLELLHGRLASSGVIEAIDGGTVRIDSTLELSNYDSWAQRLSGGTWNVIARHPIPTTLVLQDRPVVVNAATVVLDGPQSVFAALDALANNQGSLSIQGGRIFTTAGNLANSGTINVGNAASTLSVQNGTADLQQTAGTLWLDNGGVVTADIVEIAGGTISAGGPIAELDATLDYSSPLASIFQGMINGSGKAVLLHDSAATLTLSGHNSYTGGTAVQTGTLIFANAYALPAGTNVTVGSTGTIVFASGFTGPISGANDGAPWHAEAAANPVPEPGAISLLAVAVLCGLAAGLRRRTHLPPK